MTNNEKHPGGRPTLMTEETINKLEEVFALGGTDKEACFYAGISHQTLYSYQEKHPEFVERKEALKEKPILKARNTLVNALNIPEYALKFLERKKKDEFSTRSEVTGQDGKPVVVVVPAEIAHKNNLSDDNIPPSTEGNS